MLRSLLGRPRTVQIPIHGAPVEVQPVKVTRRSRRLLGSFFTTFLMFYCAQNTIKWLLSSDDTSGSPGQSQKGPSSKKDSQDSHMREMMAKYGSPKQTEHWKRQHAQLKGAKSSSTASHGLDNPDTTIVTVPIWFRTVPPRPITPQDREWQEAKELMQDKAKSDAVKEKAARMVSNMLKTRPNYAQYLNYIQFDGQIALEAAIAPRMVTPTMYEIPCIAVSPTTIGLGWATVPDGRIKRTIRPVIFAKAFYQSLKVFSVTTFYITASKLGRLLSTPTELQVRVTSKADAPSSQQTSAQPSPSPAKPAIDDALVTTDAKFFSWKAHQARVHTMTYAKAIANASRVFKSSWATQHSAALQNQTPGICHIHGTLIFNGKKGKLRLGIVAYYSPREKAFVGFPQVTSSLLIPDFAALEPVASKRKFLPQTKNKEPELEGSVEQKRGKNVEEKQSSPAGAVEDVPRPSRPADEEVRK